jgi:uncharacterized membrane protein YtjA (UPF0391 family)
VQVTCNVAVGVRPGLFFLYPVLCDTMLRYAVLFFLIAIAAAVFGFGGIAGASAWIAQALLVVFLILFVVSLIFGRRGSV